MPSTDLAMSVDGDRARSGAMDADDPSMGASNVGRLRDNPGFLAARYSFFAANIANRTLAEFGLRTRSYSLLELATVGDGMSQGEIGRILCLDKSHIVRLVDELVGQGLVGRYKDVRDGRVAIVRATPAGRELAERSAAALADAYLTMFAGLSESDRQDAFRVLRMLGLRF
jgi:DNA-binding MarR family transcriptional regulator